MVADAGSMIGHRRLGGQQWGSSFLESTGSRAHTSGLGLQNLCSKNRGHSLLMCGSGAIFSYRPYLCQHGVAARGAGNGCRNCHGCHAYLTIRLGPDDVSSSKRQAWRESGQGGWPSGISSAAVKKRPCSNLDVFLVVVSGHRDKMLSMRTDGYSEPSLGGFRGC